MPLQNFIDKVTTVTAAWLNQVDVLLTTVFQGATTALAARNALGITLPMLAYKTADTVRLNVISTLDPDLQVNVPGAGTYRYELFLNIDGAGSTTNGFQCATYCPTGFTQLGTLGHYSGIVNTASINQKAITQSGAGTDLQLATLSATRPNDIVRIVGTFIATGAGTFGLIWAQANVADPTGTILKKGSYLTLMVL